VDSDYAFQSLALSITGICVDRVVGSRRLHGYESFVRHRGLFQLIQLRRHDFNYELLGCFIYFSLLAVFAYPIAMTLYEKACFSILGFQSKFYQGAV